MSFGSVFAANSSRLVNPSPSTSLAASLGSFGLRPNFVSQSFGRPSWSASASTLTTLCYTPQNGQVSLSVGIGFPQPFFALGSSSPCLQNTRPSLARKLAFFESTALR